MLHLSVTFQYAVAHGAVLHVSNQGGMAKFAQTEVGYSRLPTRSVHVTVRYRLPVPHVSVHSDHSPAAYRVTGRGLGGGGGDDDGDEDTDAVWDGDGEADAV